MNQQNCVHFYFIFSLNNSGTTVMSQFLNQAILNSYLSKYGNYEGQNIPTVKDLIKPYRWDTNHHLDWTSIHSAWSKEAILSGKKSFIEASPPNIIRVEEIINHFKNKSCIFSNSSPYHYVASSVRNYWNHVSFKEAINETLKSWTKRSGIQINNMKKYPEIPFVSYESFCKNPYLVSEALKVKTSSRLEGQKYNISGKRNLPIKKIIDMTPRHLAYLGLDGLEQINEYLQNNSKILNEFGYNIISEKKANRIIRRHPLLAQIGLRHRIKRDLLQN